MSTDRDKETEESEARFRLHDILPEEVSYVDRAANRRRFLVIKDAKHAGGHQMSDKSAATETKKGPIPTPVKESVLRVLTEVLERGVSLTNMIKEAEETAEQMAEPMPPEFASEMRSIAELLTGALSRYPSPTSMAEKAATPQPAGIGIRLAELAEALGRLSLEVTSTEKASVDELAKMRSFVSDFTTALVAAGDAPPAPASPEPQVAPDDVEKTARLGVRRLAQYKEAVKSLEDAFARFMRILSEVEPSVPEEKRLAESTPQTPDPKPAAEMGNIGGGGDTTDGKAGPKIQQDVPELAELMKRLDTLGTQVAQIASTPMPQGSRPEADVPPVKGGDKERTRRGSRQGGPWVW
jgi:hypothetical protein